MSLFIYTRVKRPFMFSKNFGVYRIEFPAITRLQLLWALFTGKIKLSSSREGADNGSCEPSPYAYRSPGWEEAKD